MSKITQFDRQSLRALRVDLDSAMASIASKYGIELSAGNISFTSETATIKVDAGIIGSNGRAVTKEAKAFDQYKRLVGLGDLNIGDSVNVQGKQYTITGYKPRSKKSPVCIENAKGQGYKVSVEMIKNYNSNLINA
tara:strand:- start:383 stop:790 length:408 start_codon:yes stop_codon:yes gene_type:complete